MAQLQIFLDWSAIRAPLPFSLSSDLRYHLYNQYHKRTCSRCDTVVETKKSVNVCFFRNERLCFSCYHAVRWPTAENGRVMPQKAGFKTI